MIAGICALPRLPCPCTKRHVMLNLTSTGMCNTATSALCVTCFFNAHGGGCCCTEPSKSNEYEYEKEHLLRRDSKMCCCCCRLCCGARTTNERIFSHPYSMMHRRLPTAGIEVAPHYHELLISKKESSSKDLCVYGYISDCKTYTPVVLLPKSVMTSDIS